MTPFGMTSRKSLCHALCSVVLAVPALAQAPAQKAIPIDQAIDLAEKHRCEEALPLLKKLSPEVNDKQVRYRAEIATAHCGIKLKDGRATVLALLDLKHEFPDDPEVLYLTTQVFLEIAERASQELAVTASNSYQAGELQAETFESQEKWKDAAAIYRKILLQYPNLLNIHYKLGRAILSDPESTTSAEDATKEFEQELTIDPMNASAEFWIGEIARLSSKWEDAIPHFAAASKLDPNYASAFLGLGMSMNAVKRFPEAVAPLERYTKLAPNDAAGHYQLANAYAHTDREEDSARERALMREIAAKREAAPAAQGTEAPKN